MDAAGILKAYELGIEKVAIKPGDVSTQVVDYDPKKTAVFGFGEKGELAKEVPMNAITAAHVNPNLLPGQYMGQKGTTVYNPLRSAPEVEAILGEARYNPARPENETEKLKIAVAEKETQIAALATKVDQLTEMVAIQASQTAPARRGGRRKKETENS